MKKVVDNKIDNLFVVESPLQALVAVELSLNFKSERNAIIYRLTADRERNNQQIKEVLENGSWSFVHEVFFKGRRGISIHLSISKTLNELRKKLSGNVSQLFIGEFRSQWMHFMRAAIHPNRTVLIDDGTATLSSKRKFIDKGIFYPENLWKGRRFLNEFIKFNIYRKFLNFSELNSPIFIASAFFKSESLYSIDFSNIKNVFKSNEVVDEVQKVFFFGSKYSEAKIISLQYELNFLRVVKNYYSGFEVVYCAHRDESESKLSIIREELGFEVIAPDMPAEIFLLENNSRVAEISGAYSSVLNNIRFLLPEVKVRAFRLRPEEINNLNRDDIAKIYDYFRLEGVDIEGE